MNYSGSYATGNPNWKGLDTACDYVEAMNYELVRRVTYFQWNKLELLPAIEDCNVRYIHTHGNSGSFWTDANDYWYSYPNPPSLPPENAYPVTVPMTDPNGFAIKPSRIVGNGTGLPPINSTRNPPINLAFIDACCTGVENYFAEALLYPHGNIYAGTSWWPENQSQVGYSIIAKLDETKPSGQAFWEELMNEKTVDEARQAFFEAYKGSNKPATADQLLHVWGDFYTRMSGVYTGNYGHAPKGWYREIAL